MKKDVVISVIGTGAVGGYYGSLLQRAGNEVHFLLRSDVGYVHDHGLEIESCNGNFRLPTVCAHGSHEEMPPSDVVIVALKTTANRHLPAILPSLLKENGVVLTLQNGLGSEDEIAKIVGAARVMGGLCFLCANKVGPGHIRHLDYGLITVGEYFADGRPGGITGRLEHITGLFATAGIPVKPVEDLLHARWKKLVWNIPFNGLSVVRNALTDALVRNPETRLICEVLMQEVAAASAACARPIDEVFIRKMMKDTETMKPYATSMKLDFDQGRPMEVESIYGNPVRVARAAGVAMPETESLYWQLQAMNPTD